jgi:hypothetical protein
MTTTDPPSQPEIGTVLHLRALGPQHADLPATPSPAAMAEAVALLAARRHGIADLGLSSDVPAADIIRALINIGTAVLGEFDEATEFLQMIGREAVHDLNQ